MLSGEREGARKGWTDTFEMRKLASGRQGTGRGVGQHSWGPGSLPWLERHETAHKGKSPGAVGAEGKRVGRQPKVALGPFLSPRESGLREKGEPWGRGLGHASEVEDRGLCQD